MNPIFYLVIFAVLYGVFRLGGIFGLLDAHHINEPLEPCDCVYCERDRAREREVAELERMVAMEDVRR